MVFLASLELDGGRDEPVVTVISTAIVIVGSIAGIEAPSTSVRISIDNLEQVELVLGGQCVQVRQLVDNEGSGSLLGDNEAVEEV